MCWHSSSRHSTSTLPTRTITTLIILFVSLSNFGIILKIARLISLAFLQTIPPRSHAAESDKSVAVKDGIRHKDPSSAEIESAMKNADDSPDHSAPNARKAAIKTLSKDRVVVPEENVAQGNAEYDNGSQYGPRNERQKAVVAAFKWAWDAYKRCAWGYDELQPVRCRGVIVMMIMMTMMMRV